MKKVYVTNSCFLFSSVILGGIILGTGNTAYANETTNSATLSSQIPTIVNTSPTSEDTISQASTLILSENTNSDNSSELVNNQVNHSAQLPSPETLSNDSTTPEVTDDSISPNSEPNLIKNSDFSQVIPSTKPDSQWTDQNEAKDWTIYTDQIQSKTTTPSVQVDNGKLIIESTQDFRGAVTQKVQIDSSKQYQISFDIETENKVGQAFVRILEKKPSAELSDRIWLSPMTNGTANRMKVTKIYNPLYDVSEVTFELYYEKGTGKVVFDNLSMIAVGSKDTGAPKPLPHEMEDSISCALNKKYLFNHPDYHYTLADSSIAQLENGLLIPKASGQTTITITAPGGQVIKEIPLSVLPSAEDNYDTLAKEWIDVTFGNNSFDASDENMLRLFNELETKVASHISSFNPQDDHIAIWNDLKNYANSPDITGTYRRFEEIAKQVVTPTSQFYQSVDAIRIVKEGMAWMNLNVYNPNKDIEGKANWWDYEIGSPRAIVNTLCLLNDYFTIEEIKRYTDTIEHFVPDSNYFRMTLTNPFAALGGNLVDMGRVKIISGILRKDNQLIAKATTSLNNLFTTVSEGNGFYKDGSYIDHTNVAYTGAYGNVLIDGISQLLPVVQKTDHKIPDNNIKLIYQWIDNSFLPLIVHGELMDMSRGRSISRETSPSHAATIEVLRGFLRLANMSDSKENLELKAKIKSILQSDTYYNPYDNLKSYQDIASFKALLADSTIKPYELKTQLTTFNSMDKVAYYNAEKDFAFALSLYSNRTQNFEAMNNENTRGWYTSDGMFYLYNDDLAHYSNNYWPTVNPYFMPGTTENTAIREDVTSDVMKKYGEEATKKTGQVTNPSSFVGSLAFNNYFGSATMDFTNWDNTLTANKSWVILNDKIVLLGNSITSTSKDSVFTTIEQRKENQESPYKVYINGELVTIEEGMEHSHSNVKTILLESSKPELNIGYVFLEPATVAISKLLQTGSWHDINLPTKNTELKSNTFITIKQEHTATSNTYAYYMVPKATSDQLYDFSHNHQVQLVQNNKQLQVIYDKSSKLWTVIKKDSKPFLINNQIQLTNAGIYMVQKLGNTYKIATYNPMAQKKKETTISFKHQHKKFIFIKTNKLVSQMTVDFTSQKKFDISNYLISKSYSKHPSKHSHRLGKKNVKKMTKIPMITYQLDWSQKATTPLPYLLENVITYHI
ncbi:Hyaluronate lyase precursor [Streptococcus parauberis]|uniref:polysaccharide lyase 8 family protein n=1 Tax=Streptococcus parauberis TaxID=1348 RepID=UPI000CCEA255|nr:polysaccharide lyase 8 family protein [Streptococcus parauberis]PNY21067.1 Hyaluronate lyase precursor [Streptococcus parauberis]